MSVLIGSHGAFLEHDPGADHPESPDRLAAVLRGISSAGVGDAVVPFAPRRATRDELARVHDIGYVSRLEETCLVGGGRLDPDTAVSPASYEAAIRGAGAGLDAVARLDRGEAVAAFLALRPPGHHATVGGAMGFCLLNNVAVTAAGLVARGERVLVVDWDAHHGNGTQAAFYGAAEVLFVSLHQFPFYPGSGSLDEIGEGEGEGATVNMPFPAGTAGDAYRMAVEEVVVPAAEQFSPTWLLVSAGFDAHRDDPLTDLGLSATDFGDLTERVSRLVLPGRRIFFLEGGYDLDALAASAGATVAALVGSSYRPEPPTTVGRHGSLGSPGSGGPAAVIEAARSLHELHQRT
ncbi:MAG TPA: histone deacetylase [Acidimicrobiales bacterium]|nr:histone deacetylase [Acidimicrobiales bacterium]